MGFIYECYIIPCLYAHNYLCTDIVAQSAYGAPHI